MEGQREFGSLMRMALPVALCVLAAGAAVLSLVVADGHFGAPVPALAYLVAAAVMGWTPVSRWRVSRVTLGLVMVGSSFGTAALLYVASGGVAALVGVAMMVLGVGYTLMGYRALPAPAARVEWAPLVLVAAAAALVPVMYLTTRAVGALAISVLFLGATAARVFAAPHRPDWLGGTRRAGPGGSIGSSKQQSR
ncbi:hypothetical protein [Alloactinosynnema sp. L-07]|uniref:hypothetical protein n=1 Tax=Alloactinosynnema sp. L-07 TaxID=1653480 RepID=UPI00065EF6F0|nr:hypothetical protein [Alloactinosynnema sp. L-07]CRK59984.1 hypothetical protein [Alloactinosynnema sp. L-07]